MSSPIANIVFSILISIMLATSATAWQLTDGALVHPEYHGSVPKKSDVIFSTRFKRDAAPSIAKAFNATRVEWVYSSDKAYIESLKADGRWFGGTINSNIKLANDDGNARDFGGNLISAPWMKTWKDMPKWITTTHPASEKALRDEAAQIISAGADSIQVDDPLLQLQSIEWGGDFNPATLAGFNNYLSTYPSKDANISEILKSDYRGFLKSNHGIKNTEEYIKKSPSIPANELWTKYLRYSVRQHFIDFRSFLKSQSSKPIALSMNLSELSKPDENIRHFFLAQFTDYVMAETTNLSTTDLAVRIATLRALGVGYAPSIKPKSVPENRVAIATLYAMGSQPLVPWDVYAGNDSSGKAKQRYFGSVTEYGDLYSFVRRYPKLFDNTEATAVVGIPIPVDKFRADDTMKVIQKLNQMQVPFAFLLTGGVEQKFKIEADRARHFKILIKVNPDADFTTTDLKDLHALPVAMVNSNDITDTTIIELSPISVVGSADNIKIYPRVNPSEGGQNLLIHLIDESKIGEYQNDPSCKRSLNIKRNIIGSKKVAKATYYSQKSVFPVSLKDNETVSQLAIPECSFWGVISLDFQ